MPTPDDYPDPDDPVGQFLYPHPSVDGTMIEAVDADAIAAADAVSAWGLGPPTYNLLAEEQPLQVKEYPRTDWGDEALRFQQYLRTNTKIHPAGNPELTPTWFSALLWRCWFYPFRGLRWAWMRLRRHR